MLSLSALHQKQGKSQLTKMGLMSAVTVLVSIFALGQGSSSNLDMWTTTQTILRDIRAFVGLPDTLRACGYLTALLGMPDRRARTLKICNRKSSGACVYQGY